MRNHLTAPAPGTPVSAQLLHDILAELRRLRLIEGPGIRLGHLPSGTVVSADPGLAGKSKSTKTKGCFEMTLTKDEGGSEEPTYTATFENPYYSVGGRTYEAEIGQLEELTGTEIIALKVSADAETSQPTPELTSYADLGEMQGDQDDEYVYVIPLYKIEDGKVKCDFRLGASAAMWEFPGS